MSDLLETRSIQCPCCWETIEVFLDLSAGDQVYTEDCTVCCRPMSISVSLHGSEATVTVEAE